MRSVSALAVLVAALGLPWFAHAQRQHAASYVPPNGFVPDSATAVRIAVAVWIPIYGERLIRSESPYHASLHDTVWIVSGSIPCPAGQTCIGGAAIAEIAKRDARVLRVIHTQ